MNLQQEYQTPVLDADTEQKVVAWVNRQYTLLKQARQNIESQWYINLAFYFGKQYVEPQSRSQSINAIMGGKLVVPQAPPWRMRLVINRIRPIIRTELSKIAGQKPSVTVIPASSEDRDYFAAQAGEQIWDSIYRDKKVKNIIKRAVWWTLITGTGFVKSWWDPEEIDPVTKVPGSICFNPVTPFHLLVPDLREEDLENQPYIIEVQARSVDWVTLNYPNLTNVQPDTAEVNDILEDSFLNLVSGKQAEAKTKSVIVKEVWIKPGQLPQLPTGGMLTIINNKVVQFYQEWPYIHNKYPYAKIDHIPCGKFYNESTIVDLIPLQKELNRTRSQVIEAKNSMAKPRIMAYKGSVSASMITSQPGQVILVTPGFDLPTVFPQPPLPSYVADEIERILIDITDISGQHEVSKGQTPPGVTAATAISYLQEQDETMISTTYDSVEDAVEKIAYMSLSYVKQYWDLPRVVKVTGVDGSFDSMNFMGSDLGDNTDVQVEAGSSLPTSKAARQAFIMDLMKFGWITPQQGLDVLDMGGINKITDQIRVDTKQAQRENQKMAAVTQDMMNEYMQLQLQQAQINPQTGMPGNPEYVAPPNDPISGAPIAPAQEAQPPSFDPNQLPGQQVLPEQPQIPQILNPPLLIPVNTWDNHAVHITTHNNFRKSQAFEQLDDLNKQLFEAHVQDHMAAAAQSMMQMQQPMPLPSNNNQPPGQLDQYQADSQQQQPPDLQSQLQPGMGG